MISWFFKVFLSHSSWYRYAVVSMGASAAAGAAVACMSEGTSASERGALDSVPAEVRAAAADFEQATRAHAGVGRYTSNAVAP
jgi:hypothetical protein